MGFPTGLSGSDLAERAVVQAEKFGATLTIPDEAIGLRNDGGYHGAAHPSDGKNVVLHEFAHQLDFENDAVDGVPGLATREQQVAWADVMRSEFASLRAADESGVPTLLDTYGATDPAEFFAVSVEAFFERPHALRAHHPKLYAELRKYFQQNPVEFSAEG